MLKKATILFWLLIVILQLWLVGHLQLFGDEAFYWLEGQNLAWSYAELPGWNAWMIRLGTEIFGNNYFAVRFFSFIAYLGIFWAIWLLNKNTVKQNIWLPVSMPIVAIVATMALPDIWLLFFVMWSSYFVIKATKDNKNMDWLILGVLMACSVNVHVRMWIWLFFAGTVFIGVYYSQIKIIKSALLITLPVTLLGLLPVLIFNLTHDFPLLNFQLSQRHPWQFQFSNINFLLAQFIVITPIVLILWFKNIFAFSKEKSVNWLLLTAISHWLFYIVMSFFVDALRINIHWLIISYLPVLVISNNTKLKTWAIITGSLATFILLIFLSVNKQQKTNLQARLLDNSMGWQQLATEVQQIKTEQGIANIIADYFMTGAELAFAMNDSNNIKILSHAKNIKHGREKQLAIMGLLLEKPKSYSKPALLIVEDSTLKLQEKGKYYQQLCDDFQKLRFIQSININNTNKQYHVFKINASEDNCDIPPLFYINHKLEDNNVVISGWAILHNIGIQSLVLVSDNTSFAIANNRLINTGIKSQFPQIHDPNYPNNGFTIDLPISKITTNKLQIIATDNNGKKYISALYFLN